MIIYNLHLDGEKYMTELTKIHLVYREEETEDSYEFIKIGYFTTEEKAKAAKIEYCKAMKIKRRC